MKEQDKLKEEIPKNVKRFFGGGWRRPIIDGMGLKWCNCLIPNLTSNRGGRGQAYCLRCKEYWYH